MPRRLSHATRRAFNLGCGNRCRQVCERRRDSEKTSGAAVYTLETHRNIRCPICGGRGRLFQRRGQGAAHQYRYWYGEAVSPVSIAALDNLQEQVQIGEPIQRGAMMP